MHRLESRLIQEKYTMWPTGLNRHWVDYKTHDYRKAEMERLESDPGYIQFANDIDEFLAKTELVYASDNPERYENLEDWEIDPETNTLVRIKQ